MNKVRRVCCVAISACVLHGGLCFAAPAPPTAPPSQEQLRHIAESSGPGSCDDVRSVRSFPTKSGLLGPDAAYNRIIVHVNAYKQCLLSALSDTSPVEGVALTPGIPAETLSDVAYALLVDAGLLKWGACAPREVAGSSSGASAFYKWLSFPANRAQWQACIVRRAGA